MKRIAFITPPDANFGFSLSGVPQEVAESVSEETLKKNMEKSENGVVVIDERFISAAHEGKGLPEERLRELEDQWQGILLILPSPEKPPAEAEDYAARLIRRAIGYHVRLKV